jgi:hypothetical protein
LRRECKHRRQTALRNANGFRTEPIKDQDTNAYSDKTDCATKGLSWCRRRRALGGADPYPSILYFTPTLCCLSSTPLSGASLGLFFFLFQHCVAGPAGTASPYPSQSWGRILH